MSLKVGSFEGLDDWLAEDAPISDLHAVLETSRIVNDKEGRKISTPLRSRHVEAYLNFDAGLSETKEILSFASPDNDCTANFKFPLPPNAAVRRFAAKIGRKNIKTFVKEKAEADKEYNDAVSQGHTSVRMSQQSKQNIFQVSLGNLAASEEAEITIHYIRLLQQTGNAMEYVHTATWVPPYFSWRDGNFCNDQASKVSYPLTYSITLQDSTNLKKDSVYSSTHTTLNDTLAQGLKINVSEEVSDPSKDFQLAVEMESCKGHQAIVQTAQVADDPGKTVSTALISFSPEIKKEAGPKTKRQVMLVIDGSGSMSGAPAEQARESAELLIRDLPSDEGVMFNIMMFGSSFTTMWNDYKLYNASTESSAIQWLQAHCNAEHGGTELLGALQAVYNTPVEYGYRRSVVLLTDGGVGCGQDQQLTDLVTPKSWDTHMTHVFVLGIGHGVHRPLLDSVAAKSHGLAQYVMESSEIAQKMGRLSEAALATNCVFEPCLKCHGCTLDFVPTKMPNVIYPGQPLTILATITSAEQGASVEMVGKDSKGTEMTYRLSLPTSSTCQGDSFKALHAMSKISELTSDLTRRSMYNYSNPDRESKNTEPSREDVKAKIIQLAIAEGLVTEYTSYVGVELRSDPMDPSKVIEHEVPIQAPAKRLLFQDYGANYMYATAVPGCVAYAGNGSDYAESEEEDADMGFGLYGTQDILLIEQSDHARANSGYSGGDMDMSQGCAPQSTTYDSYVQESVPQTDIYGSSTQELEPQTADKQPEGQTMAQALSKLRTTGGFWMPSEAFYKLVFSKRTEITDKEAEFMKTAGGYELNVFATILALAFLDKHVQKEKSVWLGMRKKAVCFLEAKVDQGAKSIDGRIMDARLYV